MDSPIWFTIPIPETFNKNLIFKKLQSPWNSMGDSSASIRPASTSDLFQSFVLNPGGAVTILDSDELEHCPPRFKKP